MRSILLILFVLSSSYFCYSQKGIKCTKCKKNKKEIQKHFLNKYIGEYDILFKNRKEYFGTYSDESEPPIPVQSEPLCWSSLVLI
jgi:hypothetical protein